jgi:TolA-binding protein
MGVRAIILGALLALAPGCFWATTKHEGRVMREQIKNVDERLAHQEKILEGRVEKLDESIAKATKMIALNSADLGTQVDSFSQEMAVFAGRLETVQRTFDAARSELAQVKTQQADLMARLESIERQLGIRPGVPGEAVPATIDKNVLFDGALAKLQAGQHADARRELRLFVQAFPQDPRAERAAFHVGESFYKEKDYEKAIAEFQRVVDTYPKGEMADDAWFYAGTAALDAKLCIEAGAYLGELIRLHPSSPFVRQARQKLDHARKNAKNSKICKS